MDKFNDRTTDIGAADVGADISRDMGASELIAYERAMTALRRWVESMERTVAPEH